MTTRARVVERPGSGCGSAYAAVWAAHHKTPVARRGGSRTRRSSLVKPAGPHQRASRADREGGVDRVGRKRQGPAVEKGVFVDHRHGALLRRGWTHCATGDRRPAAGPGGPGARGPVRSVAPPGSAWRGRSAPVVVERRFGEAAAFGPSRCGRRGRSTRPAAGAAG